MKSIQELMDEVEDLPETMSEKAIKLSAGVRQALARPSVRAKLQEASTLQWQDPEFQKRMSAARKGRVVSDETKVRISKAQLARDHEAFWTEERRAKMSKAKQGTRLSEEAKRKVGLAVKGRVLSEETKAKIGAAKKGKPGPKPTAETNAKRSATLKNVFANVSEDVKERRAQGLRKWLKENSRPSLTDEQKQKQRERMASLKWFNNGAENKRLRECPAGWQPGRIKK